MTTLATAKDPTMWKCEKYGVSMLAARADDFCTRRFAAANRKGGTAVIGFSHCSICPRGAALYDLVGPRRGMFLPRKEFITW
ncbi:MAG: hypothetical protein WA946_06770 [Nitrospirota bacterium]